MVERVVKQWVEDFVETIEIGLEADELKVGNKNAIFHWVWQEHRIISALHSIDVRVSDVMEVMKKVRQRITDFNVTLNVNEAHQQLDQELQFLKHKVELLAKAEIEGWNVHFVEQVFHQINQCLLKIEKALCEVSASQADREDDAALGARCRKEVRITLMDSELSDEACLRIDDFCQKRWQRIMAENGGGLFDFWDWSQETAEERQWVRRILEQERLRHETKARLLSAADKWAEKMKSKKEGA